MQLERHGWDIHALSAAGRGSGPADGWDAWGEWYD